MLSFLLLVQQLFSMDLDLVVTAGRGKSILYDEYPRWELLFADFRYFGNCRESLGGAL
jgi:hypothetical protein